MAAEEASQTPAKPRYSLRTRTPVKPEPALAAAAAAATPTPRKRARAPAASSNAKKTPKTKASQRTPRKSITPSTARKGRGRGAASTPSSRGKGRSGARQAPVSNEQEEGMDAAEASSGDEELNHEQMDDQHNQDSVSAATPRRGPGRPRKGASARKNRDSGAGDANDLSATPAKRSWEARRVPVHLTKHDPFRQEFLDEAARIIQVVPVNGTVNDDRYELMKMSDALKLCGYELGVIDPTSGPLDEIYHLLSWSLHAAGPNGPSHPSPQLSEQAKAVLIKIFASIGRRIREETKDMAGYHRRHAARKLLLAKTAGEAKSPSASVEPGEGDEDGAGEDGSPAAASNPRVLHRRNPLKIPAPLIDVWREPYRRAADADGGESPASDGEH